MPIRHRIAPLAGEGCPPPASCGISRGFPRLYPCGGQVAYVLLTRAPVAGGRVAAPPLPLDLHVLSLSLAFILSQDQTLRCWLSCLKISLVFAPAAGRIFLVYRNLTCLDSVIDEACRACALRLLYYFISLVYCNRFSVLGIRPGVRRCGPVFFRRKGFAKLRIISVTANFFAVFVSAVPSCPGARLPPRPLRGSSLPESECKVTLSVRNRQTFHAEISAERVLKCVSALDVRGLCYYYIVGGDLGDGIGIGFPLAGG